MGHRALPPAAVARCATGLALGVWLVYLSTAGGSLATGDAVAIFEQAASMLDRGALDVPPEYSHPNWQGLDGRYYLAFGIAQAVYDVPFVALGRGLATLVGWREDPDTLAKAIVALAVTIPCAASAAFTLLIAFRLSSHVRASALAALMLAFGTLVWPYSKYGFNAGLATAALTAGIYGLAAGRLDRRVSRLFLGGAALGVGLLTRHELAIAVVVGMAWLAVESRGAAERWRWLAAAAAGPTAAACVWTWLNYVHFGHPLKTGHAPGFGVGGLAGFLVSPSGSVFLYSPVALAVLALIGRNASSPTARLVGGVVIAQTLFYMLIDDWLGTRSYGPRYLVPLLPLLTAPFAIWWAQPLSFARRQALGALCAFSVLVQLPAIPVEASRVGMEAGQPAAPARRTDWTWSPILLNARATAAEVPANVRAIATGTGRPAVGTEGPLSERLAGSLDFWWLYLYYLGVIPAWMSLLIGGLLFGAGASVAGAAWRRTRDAVSS